MRRTLQCNSLKEVNDECRRLLESGYRKRGKWSLGQICRHVRLTMECNLDGFPRWMIILGFPLRPALRRFFLPRLLRGDSPAGIRTAPSFVPPADLDDQREVELFCACVDRFLGHEGSLHAHPGFGHLDKAGFERLHVAHSTHHLSFLEDEKRATPSEDG